MSVAIIIVNYKTPELVNECLASLAKEPEAVEQYRVFVGDADSQDGSTEIISRYIEENDIQFATCFDIGGNHGFAYGNNYILKTRVLPDPQFRYVHFLNPDTYIHPGAVSALLEALRARPEAGVVGSRLENPDGSLRAYAFRFPSLWREFFRGAQLPHIEKLLPNTSIHIPQLRDTRKVDWVTGASFMMPREVIEEVGLMDDRYFLYFEEVDLMFRVHKAGYEVWHVAESRVVHLAGQATGVRAEATLKRLPPFWFHSRFKFFRDRYGLFGAVMANIVFLSGDLLLRLHRLLRLKPQRNLPYLWEDMFAHGFVAANGERPQS